MTTFKIIGILGFSWLVFGMGMLFAVCPINDRDTSTTHKVVTAIITLAIVAIGGHVLWSM